MDKVGGPLGVVAIAAVAFLVIGLAILHFGFHVFRRKGKTRVKSGIMNDRRIEVLETTVIDADRRLVLIRCDRIEHLIMIGGPADLVVENDVRRLRGPSTSAAKVPGLETEKRAAPTPAVEEKRSAAAARPAQPVAVLPEPPLAPVPKAEPQRTAPRPATEARPAVAAPRALPAGNRAGAPQPKAEEPARAAPQRPLAAEAPAGRRDIAPVRRPPATAAPSPRPPLAAAPNARSAEPHRSAPPAAANDRAARPARANGRADPGAALPAAQIPWSDPDSIENEIVRALRFDPQPRAETPARREPPPAKPLTDSNTTLGDLADRLEEALAREVQSASRPAATAEPGDFSFESEPAPPAALVEPPKPKAAPPQKVQPGKRERPEPQRAAAKPAAEADASQEPAAERREEAPVISLNSRRRESADQLEDEMARLLGELTGDSKGR